MWCYVAGKVSSDVSKYRCTDQPLKMNAPWSFEMSETLNQYSTSDSRGLQSSSTEPLVSIYTNNRRNRPDDRNINTNINIYGCENLKPQWHWNSTSHGHIRWYSQAHVKISVIALLYCSNSCTSLHFKILNSTDIQPHTDTLYNKCKSTFQFSNLAKYGHGPPEDGFKGDRNV